jgi:hypothetical protein
METDSKTGYGKMTWFQIFTVRKEKGSYQVGKKSPKELLGRAIMIKLWRNS